MIWSTTKGGIMQRWEKFKGKLRPEHLNFIRGIEKEGLRITEDGQLSESHHPASLGQALTHPYITTDFAEPLLELVSPPTQDANELIHFFEQLHHFVLKNIGDELIWPNSMPCLVKEKNIPIAQYGKSPNGLMKTIYRKGLEVRYGKGMQVIAGLHFNFSFSEKFLEDFKNAQGIVQSQQNFVSSSYFHMIRNFYRYSWILNYLFGASPALCASFLGQKKKHGLVPFKTEKTFHLPHATSLRMGPLGYNLAAQEHINIRVNRLSDYVSDLNLAIKTPHPQYEKIGRKKDGEYLQLNTHQLQIENEYYGPIRPKRVSQRGERPTVALKNRGVEYLEVRCLDLNPLLPLGFDREQIYFLDLFLLFCLMEESPTITDAEMKCIEKNNLLVVQQGRDPHLQIYENTKKTPFSKVANQMLMKMQELTTALPEHYTNALTMAMKRVEDSEQTPSAKLLEILRNDDLEYFHWNLAQSENHKEDLLNLKPDPKLQSLFLQTIQKSVQDQTELEKNGQSLESYLKEYFRG